MTKHTTLDQWRLLAQKELKDVPLDDLIKETPEGIATKALYTTKDLDGSQLSLPGFAPYRRGVKATMYANRPWTIRQYAGFSTAEASNLFYKEALRGGQKGLSVAFDLPTHRGYDSDHPRVKGDVGKAGVAIDSVEDMKILFSGLPLQDVTVSMTMNGAVLPILAAFIVAAEEQGVQACQLRGTIQNDVLKEFMVRNTYIYPPIPSMRIVADIIAFTSAQMPQFNSISISGYHMQEAGADAVQELAFTLADGLEYVQAALARGLDIDAFAPRLSFFFAIGMNFFMEIAKLRAARVLWCEMMEAFSPKNPQSSMLRTHCQTSGVSLAAQDPLNNVVRTTIEAMAAVMGGTQSLHTNAYDEALDLPSETSARIARNTQLILAEETRITDVVDPLGGSYYVESLTNALVEQSRAMLVKIAAMGGMTKAIMSGFPKQHIEASAAKRQARLDSGLDVIVGVNKYKPTTHDNIKLLDIDTEAVLRNQLQRLQDVKACRDSGAVQRSLDDLKEGARGDANLLELVVHAMRARATVGEVSSALEDIFTRYNAPMSGVKGAYVSAYKDKNRTQALIARTALFQEENGRRPRILVAKLGQDGHDRGAKLIASALADFGFDVDLGSLFQTPQEVCQQAIDHDVHVIGISTQAGAHKTLIPELINALHAQGADDIMVICGGIIPENDYDQLRRAGVSAIFQPGGDVTVIADQLLALLEKNKNRE